MPSTREASTQLDVRSWAKGFQLGGLPRIGLNWNKIFPRSSQVSTVTHENPLPCCSFIPYPAIYGNKSNSNWDLVAMVVDRMGDYLCWTRMQAEAGQALEAIIARKELERQAGGGLFLWGVGSAPSRAIRPLAQLSRRIPVIFSVMRSKPKPTDTAPSRVVVWRHYVDTGGAARRLPAHCIVTSRGDSARGPKRAHYALMCRSDAPLELHSGIEFNPAGYRNAGQRGAPVGASQVTALLQPCAPVDGKPGYEANMLAELTGSYWVRLVDPLEVSPGTLAALAEAGDASLEEWCDLARRIRGVESSAVRCAEPMLV